MSLTTAYLVTNKNLEALLNAIKTARAPERFTYKFLEDLGFANSNDRLFIGLLKGLGFLDEDAVPTQRYFNFLDQSQSGAVLAEGIREAYADLFAVNTQANQLTLDEVKNKLRTLTRGDKSEKVISLMASTFRALSDLADWEAPAPATATPQRIPPEPPEPSATAPRPELPKASAATIPLHYDIQIHLPESRDPAVYDAIFQSLRKHLL